MRCLIEADGWRTTREVDHYLAEEDLTPISHPTICKILHEELGVSKVCALWVPKLLTDKHKQNRMAAAIEFLSLYHAEGESLFDGIITGDEKMGPSFHTRDKTGFHDEQIGQQAHSYQGEEKERD